ncbi:MAG: PadR family transcriptional regulator [Actinomycetia bacterium]|nr:PadR family transcriptional regulator [Actinomycetes bacterium]
MRGVLDPCLLALIGRSGAAYGYDLAAQLEHHGLGRIRGGSLYPALLRLEDRGLLASEWQAGEGGPGRKCYELTATGRTELAAYGDQWAQFTASVAGLLAAEAHR